MNNYKYVNGKKMKLNDKNILDQYFTKKNEARRLFDIAQETILEYEKNKIKNFLWIEPSVGDGCFFNLLPVKKRIGIDIDPRIKNVIKSDYLKFKLPSDKKIIVIGNPPFGNRGVVALDFINHSIEAEYICFILPMFFESVGKGSIKYRVKGFNLIKSIPVNQNSFYTVDGNGKPKDIDIKCCFQIWSKHNKKNIKEFNWYSSEKPFANLVDVFTVSTAKNRECGKKWIFDEKANFYISSTFFKDNKVVKKFDEVKYGSGIAIVYKTKDRKIISKLNNIFENANWIKYSSLATNSCRHIGKSHIYQLLSDNLL